MNQYKTCSKCRQEKPITAFHKDKYKSSGFTSDCGQCRNNRSAARRLDPEKRKVMIKSSKRYYWEHREKMAANYKSWAEQNKSRRKEIDQRFAQKNREKKAAAMRKYRKENPHIRSEWALENPDKQRAIYARRRARRNGAGLFKVAHNELARIYAQPCTYCGSLKDIQVDHVIPLAKGGTHSVGNLTAACKSCNMSKKDLFLTEWKYGKRINKKANPAEG